MRRPLRPGFVLAAAFIVLLALVALFAQVVAPYDPIAQNLRLAFAPASLAHPLGTDNIGRDVLSRVIWGARPALLGVLITLATTAVVGIPWGLAAGYVGGVTDLGLMRLADALLVFPGIILALVLTTVIGPSLQSAMVALGIVYSPVLARVVRAGVLAVRDRDFISVTRLYGYSALYRMTRHVLPNALAPCVVQLTLIAGMSLLAQTGLGFLGVGLAPPFPSWGGSLAESFRFIVINPSASFAPGFTVALTVLALYRIGDELRDRIAPRH
jgi:peptide/nickel transport system permease protein